MATKGELSEEINEALGTRIEWDRLLEDDLRLFHELVMDGDLVEPMTKQFIKENGKEQLDKKVDEWSVGQIVSRFI